MNTGINAKIAIKYGLLKAIVSSWLLNMTDKFNTEGILQMTGLIVITTTLSCIFLYAVKVQKWEKIYANAYIFVIVLIANELAILICSPQLNIVSVITSGKSFQVAFKLCDCFSLALSAYIFLFNPRKGGWVGEK